MTGEEHDWFESKSCDLYDAIRIESSKFSSKEDFGKLELVFFFCKNYRFLEKENVLKWNCENVIPNFRPIEYIYISVRLGMMAGLVLFFESISNL